MERPGNPPRPRATKYQDIYMIRHQSDDVQGLHARAAADAVGNNGNGGGNGPAVLPGIGVTDSLPPQNLAAERELLGGLLIESSDLDEVLEFLAPEDFYRDAHRTLFRAI